MPLPLSTQFYPPVPCHHQQTHSHKKHHKWSSPVLYGRCLLKYLTVTLHTTFIHCLLPVSKNCIYPFSFSVIRLFGRPHFVFEIGYKYPFHRTLYNPIIISSFNALLSSPLSLFSLCSSLSISDIVFLFKLAVLTFKEKRTTLRS